MVHFKENQVSNKENQVSNKENPGSKKVTAESKKIEREKTKKEKEAKKEEELKKKAAREEEKATALAANRVYLQQLENFALESQNTYLDMDTVTDHEDTTCSIDVCSSPVVLGTKTLESKAEFDCDIIEEIIDIPHERPTVAMKCPRGNHAKSVCTNCIALREELQECREELQQLQTMLQSRHAVNTNTDDEPKPRPGIVVSEIAQRHNMVELVPQSGVYLYPKHLREADRKENGKKRCRFLLSCFYTSAELIHAGNLTGANSKPGCNSDIIDAIIGYCLLSDKITTAADLRTAMRKQLLTFFLSEVKLYCNMLFNFCLFLADCVQKLFIKVFDFLLMSLVEDMMKQMQDLKNSNKDLMNKVKNKCDWSSRISLANQRKI
ncbi:hypothetical protein KUTeg_004631 [Tegillarca granosa]|uniref:Uncharacterized protein n=1 Tax=Tegillarca granosa TaxID=220873 RepID=A0ABQ9FPE5_TEGGR|nr:hypothetical protein KUTeg_004631 [Tegillarca granosa]